MLSAIAGPEGLPVLPTHPGAATLPAETVVLPISPLARLLLRIEKVDVRDKRPLDKNPPEEMPPEVMLEETLLSFGEVARCLQHAILDAETDDNGNEHGGSSRWVDLMIRGLYWASRVCQRISTGPDPCTIIH
jgi:hypothetical protein